MFNLTFQESASRSRWRFRFGGKTVYVPAADGRDEESARAFVEAFVANEVVGLFYAHGDVVGDDTVYCALHDTWESAEQVRTICRGCLAYLRRSISMHYCHEARGHGTLRRPRDTVNVLSGEKGCSKTSPCRCRVRAEERAK